MPYMLSVLPGDPPLSERQWQSIRSVDRSGEPPASPRDLSWQSDYDRDDLVDYLRIRHPQP